MLAKSLTRETGLNTIGSIGNYIQKALKYVILQIRHNDVMQRHMLHQKNDSQKKKERKEENLKKKKKINRISLIAR